MDKKLKRAWVRALKSGDYKQGHGCLRTTHPTWRGYCCLGVLAEIAPGSFSAHSSDNRGLKPRFRNKIGLSIDQEDVLAVMNDGEPESYVLGTPGVKPKTFKQIANWIERHL